jgi:hypothetical protein
MLGSRRGRAGEVGQERQAQSQRHVCSSKQQRQLCAKHLPACGPCLRRRTPGLQPPPAHPAHLLPPLPRQPPSLLATAAPARPLLRLLAGMAAGAAGAGSGWPAGLPRTRQPPGQPTPLTLPAQRCPPAVLLLPPPASAAAPWLGAAPPQQASPCPQTAPASCRRQHSMSSELSSSSEQLLLAKQRPHRGQGGSGHCGVSHM